MIIFTILAISFIKKSLKQNNINCSIWVISGLIAVFGTFISALIFSYIFFPIIDRWTLRYFLPEIVILWLLLGIFIQKSKNKRLFTFTIILLIILPGLSKLGLITYREFKTDSLHEQTIQIISNSLNIHNYVITDQLHMAIEPVYYGYFGLNKEHIFYIEDTKINTIPLIKNSLLIFKEPINKNLKDFIRNNGYSLYVVKENGLIGNIAVNIYKIVKDER